MKIINTTQLVDKNHLTSTINTINEIYKDNIGIIPITHNWEKNMDENKDDDKKEDKKHLPTYIYVLIAIALITGYLIYKNKKA